ncbi:hypothetical protein ACU686_16340 [Yinghuangia aomiensis]
MLRRIPDQLEAARAEAGAIASIIKDAAGDPAAAQKLFLAAEADANAIGCTVQEPDGSLTWDTNYAGLTGTEAEKRDHEKATAAKPIADRIASALRQATEADQRAAYALGQDVDFGPPDGFNANAVGGGDQADIQRTKDLLTRIASLSPAELDELNALVRQGASNQQYAVELMRSMTPANLLSLVRVIAVSAPDVMDQTEAAKQRRVQLGQIEAALGETLGMASGELYRDPKWRAELLAAGRQKDASGEYGYQDLAILMRNGNFHPEFLNIVGADIVAFERSAGGSGIWPQNFKPLNLGGAPNDGGYDPVTGLMNALSHNPEASKEFFTNADDATFKYLLHDRVPPIDTFGPHNGVPPGHVYASREALGLAIESAATGRDPQSGAPVPPHTPTTTAVMERVVNLYGQQDIKGEIPAEVRENVANALTSYVSDVR